MPKTTTDKKTTPPPAQKPAQPTARQATPARTMRLVCWCPDNKVGAVVVTEGKALDAYLVSEHALPPVGTRAFRVLKRGAEQESCYDVVLGDERETSCECQGSLRWGRCRHVDFLRALINSKRI